MVYLDRMDFWGRLVISYYKPLGPNIFITFSVKGASGENGQVLLGKKGATGNPGRDGPTGRTGSTGATGVMGPRGQDGAQGQTGRYTAAV